MKTESSEFYGSTASEAIEFPYLNGFYKTFFLLMSLYMYVCMFFKCTLFEF